MPTATDVFHIGSYHEQLIARAGPVELEDLLVRWARLAVEHCRHELAERLLEHLEELHAGRFDDEDATAAEALCEAAWKAQSERAERIGDLDFSDDPEWMVLSGLPVAVERLMRCQLGAQLVTWVGVCATVCAGVRSTHRDGTDMVSAMRLRWGIDWTVELHEVAFGLLPDWDGTIEELWAAAARLARQGGGARSVAG